MRIFADKLADNLRTQLKGIYLVFGNEPLLLHESRQLICQAGKAAGFEEQHRFVVDSQLDWNEVYDCCQALSLFSARQVIELEIPESGVTAAISKELVNLPTMLHDDILLLVTGGKLTRQQENAKWFKTLSQQAIWVNCLTPDLQRLPQFIQQRCHKLDLKPDQQALQMLAQWHEGNLLALTQSLEKLALLYPDGVLTVVRIEEALSRHNHYTPYQWMDALLAGKANRALRILRQLEAEGTELIILLRTLQRELNLLMQLKQQSNEMALGALFDRHKIWQNKRPLYSAALGRLTPPALNHFFHLLTQAEIECKTQYEQSSWPLISQLSIEFCAPSSNAAQILPAHR
jgi:DNA polymerase-3 subunit delta